MAESLVIQRYSTRSGFTHDLTRLSAFPLVGKVMPYFVLGWAIRRYSEFHMFYNRGILPQIESGRFNEDELLLLRRRGVDVYFWAYGADVRTRTETLALSEPNCCSACPAVDELCVCDSTIGEANISFIRTHASGLATMGDMRLYTTDADDSVFYWPIDLGEDGGDRFRFAPSPDRGCVVVAHAPNNRELKGTHHLEAAIETLRSEGLDVSIDLIHGVPNEVVLERFRHADIVFDQCLIGFHGYTSLEAMALGRPVLCFVRDPERDLVDSATCPIVNVRPDTITDALRTLLVNPAHRAQLGDSGRNYVATHHSLEAVGSRIEAFVHRSQDSP